MKQQPPPTKSKNPAPSGSSRVATRDLVTIGQHWRRRSRRKVKPPAMVIQQVYRSAGRYVLAYAEDDPTRRLVKIEFADLRKSFELIDDPRRRI